MSGQDMFLIFSTAVTVIVALMLIKHLVVKRKGK